MGVSVAQGCAAILDKSFVSQIGLPYFGFPVLTLMAFAVAFPSVGSVISAKD
jgi:hypothetical protein